MTMCDDDLKFIGWQLDFIQGEKLFSGTEYAK